MTEKALVLDLKVEDPRRLRNFFAGVGAVLKRCYIVLLRDVNFERTDGNGLDGELDFERNGVNWWIMDIKWLAKELHSELMSSE